MSQKIGIMGGTFDPIHHGHLVAASEVAHRFGLAEVIFVPTGEPWHKQRRAAAGGGADSPVSAAEHRYLMTVIATASNPHFHVSRVDIERPGPTYTYDTVRDIAAAYPEAELYFITGADALASIMSWHRWEELFALAQFIGVTRPGYELSEDFLPATAQERVHLVEVPAMAISSTQCRVRARAGAPVWYLVPDGVVQYIAKHQLYAPPAAENTIWPLQPELPV